jgi:hypothetical protein
MRLVEILEMLVKWQLKEFLKTLMMGGRERLGK